MKPIVVLFAGLAAFVPAGAFGAELRMEPKAVVELFTSQGCSSCPPADALLSELHQRQSVVALAYHVDYWNYIGWTDTMGSSAYSNLQRAYAQARGSQSIYTPQMMINGVHDVIGSHRQEVDATLASASLPLVVALKSDDDMLSVTVPGDASLPESTLWLVTFRQNETVSIGSGENANREISYSQIVTGRQVMGMWDPVTGAHLKLPIAEVMGTESDGAALIVQEDDHGLPGRMLGAAAFYR